MQIIGHPDLLLLLPRPRPTTNTQENIKMRKIERLTILDREILNESDLNCNKILFQSFEAIECWALSSSEGSFDLIWRTCPQICLVIPITIFIDFVFV